MTWNGRVSVHDDLSRLHASTRAGDTSREIGYSSVTEGEGSLDLLAESGAVRAQIGDQPDGRFGVSIWHRGQLRFIPDLIQELQDEDGSLSDRIATERSERLAVQAQVQGQISTERSDRQDADSALGGRIDGHDSTLSSHDTRITNAQSRADSAWTRAGTALSNAATAQSRADNAHTRIDGLNYASPNELAALEGRIASVESHIGVIDSWLRQHTGYPSGGLNPGA